MFTTVDLIHYFTELPACKALVTHRDCYPMYNPLSAAPPNPLMGMLTGLP